MILQRLGKGHLTKLKTIQELEFTDRDIYTMYYAISTQQDVNFKRGHYYTFLHKSAYSYESPTTGETRKGINAKIITGTTVAVDGFDLIFKDKDGELFVINQGNRHNYIVFYHY